MLPVVHGSGLLDAYIVDQHSRSTISIPSHSAYTSFVHDLLQPAVLPRANHPPFTLSTFLPMAKMTVLAVLPLCCSSSAMLMVGRLEGSPPAAETCRAWYRVLDSVHLADALLPNKHSVCKAACFTYLEILVGLPAGLELLR